MPTVMAVNKNDPMFRIDIDFPFINIYEHLMIDETGENTKVYNSENYPNPIDAVIDALCWIIDQDDDLINNSGIKWVKDNTYNAKLVKEAIKKQPKTKCNCQEEK
jgi:hypothetical protein